VKQNVTQYNRSDNYPASFKRKKKVVLMGGNLKQKQKSNREKKQ